MNFYIKAPGAIYTLSGYAHPAAVRLPAKAKSTRRQHEVENAAGTTYKKKERVSKRRLAEQGGIEPPLPPYARVWDANTQLLHIFCPVSPPTTVCCIAIAIRSRPALRRHARHPNPYEELSTATYYSRWRARPDSNRLLPAVLQVRFRKHLLPVLPADGRAKRKSEYVSVQLPEPRVRAPLLALVF